MSDPYAARWRALEESVLDGPGHLPSLTRRAAASHSEGLPGQVRRAAHEVTDDDISEALEEYSEEELFELVVSAAFGAAAARLARGLEGLCG